MEIEPPIRISLPQGDGHVIEMSDDGKVVTVKLLDGHLIQIDGQQSADLYKEE